MPKRRISIQTFAGLAAPALDDEDVPLEGASFASGLDPTERPGRLRGFPGDTDTGLAAPVEAYAMLDGGDTIIFYDGSAVQKITGAKTGISGTPTSIASVSAPSVQMASDGEAVYMGRGPSNTAKWIGKYKKANPNTTLSSGYNVEDVGLTRPGNVQITLTDRVGSNTPESANIPAGLDHAFAIAFEYDGFQEGPLSVASNVLVGRNDRSVKVEVQWDSPSGDSQRITAVHIYAMEGIESVGDTPNDVLARGAPRLIRRIEVDDTWNTVGSTGTDITGDEGWATGDFEVASASYYSSTSGEEGGETDYLNNSILESDVFPNANLDKVEVFYEGEIFINGSGASASISLTLTVEDSNGNVLGSDSLSASTQQTLDGKLTVSGLGTGPYKIILEGTAKSSTTSDGERADASVGLSVFADDGTGTTNIFGHSFRWEGTKGAPYRERTGLSPTADLPAINYEVSTEQGGFHFVTRAQVNGENYDSYIFRSKTQRFSQFAWAQDYLNLDTEVHSLVSFNNRLWGFSRGAAYRIDPNAMVLERTYKGRGAFARAAVTRSPMGLFWANADNLYLYDGREIRDVGGPIQDGAFPEVWDNVDTAKSPAAMTWYDPTNNALMVGFESTSTADNEVWMLHFPERRWTDKIPGPRWMHLDPPSATGSFARSFVGTDGVAYFSMAGTLYEFATGSTRAWEWISKKITADQPAVKKVFYHADLKGDPVTVEFKEDDDGTWTTVASGDITSAEGRHRYLVNNYGGTLPWTAVHEIRLRLAGAAGENVSSVSLLTRLRSRTD